MACSTDKTSLGFSWDFQEWSNEGNLSERSNFWCAKQTVFNWPKQGIFTEQSRIPIHPFCLKQAWFSTKQPSSSWTLCQKTVEQVDIVIIGNIYLFPIFCPFFFTTNKNHQKSGTILDARHATISPPKRRCLSLKKASNMSWKVSEVTFKGRNHRWLVGGLVDNDSNIYRISYFHYEIMSNLYMSKVFPWETFTSQTWFPQLQTNLVTQWFTMINFKNSWLLHILRKMRSLARLLPLPLAFCSTLKVHIALDRRCDLRHSSQEIWRIKIARAFFFQNDSIQSYIKWHQ